MRCLLLLALFASALCLPCRSQERNDAFKYPTAADYPTVLTKAPSVASFVPRGWKILARADGDLNGDKLADAALVVQGNIGKYKQANSDLGTNPFDTNPRVLLILLKNPDGKGFKLAKATKNIVGGSDSPTMDEPFDSIAIKNNVFEIHVNTFYNAGGWSASNTVYKFQDRGQAFVLIGAERKETQRNSGETIDYSYNFLSGKLKVESGNLQDDAKKHITWKHIPRGQLRAIDRFKALYEWQVVKDCYL